jgi:hypothetical protein
MDRIFSCAFFRKSDFGSFFLAAAVSLAIIDDSPRWKDVPEFPFRPSDRPWCSPETDRTGVATTVDSVCCNGSAGWWRAQPYGEIHGMSKLTFTATSRSKATAWNVVIPYFNGA